ncbi:PQQ-dependent sugar dehydrogenase [Parasediminibacterium sp. JCM 36343]|uniref:PQQ-dependent sugar dehydrogenase n=1 Tax=Parasediminibacterium sp. JCM 36343 TaxID=3374279 RepID=UPI0039790581
MQKNTLILFVITSIFLVCNSCKHSSKTTNNPTPYRTTDNLPHPYDTKSIKNFSKVIGWKDGAVPTAPTGLTVTKFADGLSHPRWIYVGNNGDVFIAESNTILKGVLKIGAKVSRKIKTQHIGESENRITMFRDENKDGIPEKRYVFAENLNQPFGMLILNNHFYVGNTDALLQFDYKTGDTALVGTGKTIVSLPAGKHNRHWARNIIANKTGDKIYIGVGSGTNVAEEGLDNEIRRADILEVNPDGTGEKIYASGLRNPCGMAWAPGTNTLWTAVNERDELGDELVPDYLTSVKEGGFYGWPYSYFGQHEDPRMTAQPRPDLVSQAIIPDVSLGAHTASLGLAFYTKKAFPAKYHNGAFIAQHGSWNRKELSGYKVVFVPFTNGKPSGLPEDFLTGFKIVGSTDSEVRGRPVDVALLADGSMLVTDDVSNTIWRVTANK